LNKSWSNGVKTRIKLSKSGGKNKLEILYSNSIELKEKPLEFQINASGLVFYSD